MELKDILQLMEAAKESGFDTFELHRRDFSLKLEKNATVPVVAAYHPGAAPAVAPTAPAEQPVPVVVPEETHATPEGKDILSPLVGIFHEAAKPAKIGDRLQKGDVVCLIEAMKLMNEVTMPEDGEIVWVAASENDTVEYDQLLFRYNP